MPPKTKKRNHDEISKEEFPSEMIFINKNEVLLGSQRTGLQPNADIVPKAFFEIAKARFPGNTGKIPSIVSTNFVVIKYGDPIGRILASNKTFHKNDIIGEYFGQIISSNALAGRHSHHVFSLADLGINNAFLDASIKGNLMAYVSHSCEPNSEAISCCDNDGHARIIFVARKQIEKNEQITIDYGWISNKNDCVFAKPVSIRCICGTRKCRGTLYLDIPKPVYPANATRLNDREKTDLVNWWSTKETLRRDNKFFKAEKTVTNYPFLFNKLKVVLETIRSQRNNPRGKEIKFMNYIKSIIADQESEEFQGTEYYLALEKTVIERSIAESNVLSFYSKRMIQLKIATKFLMEAGN